jgi:uncharacterized protein (TIGR00288 family)
MNPTDTRSTRIAVFIDFDNVEIGVKSTIGGQFDIGLVLEAIKERGEIVTKIAYSDWKRAGDYSRVLTQHAIRMVQRNLTPGGDKNGADITMALDALEMAFTHDHINAFVIVGGDSDFISLVEKLKQYGRKVIVVGGRQFTSATMQKNCHEFIAYENLVGSRGRSAERGRPAGTAPIAQALPLVMRALKVLSDREVTPQLGLLKSTLLQLDSTFSERNYGAGSFRDFMEKVAQEGAVTLKHAGRSMLVEATDHAAGDADAPLPADKGRAVAVAPAAPVDGNRTDERPVSDDADEEETLPQSPMSMQDGIKTVQRAFTQSASPPRWPMYVRQAKQFLRGVVEDFDERKYGFATLVDLLRAAGREGVVRIERDRHGAVRVFPGQHLESRVAPAPVVMGLPVDDAEDGEDAPLEAIVHPADGDPGDGEMPPAVEVVEESPIVEALTIGGAPAVEAGDAIGDENEEGGTDGDVDGNRVGASVRGAVARKRRAPAGRSTKTSRAPRARSAKPRSRKSTSGS